ncbi:MAG: apolipoprotein N-acyltransferase [Desulfovibrionaceae bacterium]
MSRSLSRSIAATLLVLGVVGAWLGFANPLYHLPVAVLLFPAGLFAAACAAPTVRRAWRRGLLAATAAYGGCLYWVAIPPHDYGGMAWYLAAPCPVLLAFYLALYPALFCVLVRLAAPALPRIALALFAGAAWGALEWLRGVLFTGFPWLTLPSAFVPWPEMIQAASIMGSLGLAALLAAIACLATASLRGDVSLPGALLAMALFAALAAHGRDALDRAIPETGSVQVRLVQGNIDQGRKWEPAYQQGTVNRYLTLSAQKTDAPRPELIVWPETAMPFYFQEINDMSRAVRNAAHQLDAMLVVGAPGYRFGTRPGVYEYFNRAFLVGKDGVNEGVYDKEHLVPFGEYVPYGEYLTFIQKLTAGVGDFSPGAETAPLVPGARSGHGAGDIALGTLICYETIFPELAQKRVADGANVLLNISNDAWFGRTAAPVQHLHLTALRAVEQGKYLIRATNTGISAIIDPRGRILAHTGLFRAQVLDARVGLVAQSTLYHRIAPAVPWVLAGLTLLGLAWAGLTGRAGLDVSDPRNTL